MPEASVPNIYAVAKRAGVSTATVSRVLSRPEVVAPSTRRKVMRAVELLGYVPNSAAKNLRTLRSGKLLVTSTVADEGALHQASKYGFR